VFLAPAAQRKCVFAVERNTAVYAVRYNLDIGGAALKVRGVVDRVAKGASGLGALEINEVVEAVLVPENRIQ